MRHPLLQAAMACLCLSVSAQSPDGLLISEYMANPAAVPDRQGEYVELYNTTAQPISLQGCALYDARDRFAAINDELIVPPQGFAVIGRSATPHTDAQLPDSPLSFSLSNMGGDYIMLLCGEITVCFTAYQGFQTSGVAMELKSSQGHLSGFTQEEDYQPAAQPFYYLGASTPDYGSPGTAGSTQVPFSNIRERALPPTPALHLYPTLTSGPLQLEWAQPLPVQSQLLLLSEQGQAVQQYTLAAGSRSFALSAGHLPPGKYIAQLRQGHSHASAFFFVAR